MNSPATTTANHSEPAFPAQRVATSAARPVTSGKAVKIAASPAMSRHALRRWTSAVTAPMAAAGAGPQSAAASTKVGIEPEM
jgi:hypothetical protein